MLISIYTGIGPLKRLNRAEMQSEFCESHVREPFPIHKVEVSRFAQLTCTPRLTQYDMVKWSMQ
jgi:hypothetical protein